jgi:hypothetical protein
LDSLALKNKENIDVLWKEVEDTLSEKAGCKAEYIM